ncbi:MAG: PolC-type DNA polymerase III [Candidatus Methylumidiphilus sp.]
MQLAVILVVIAFVVWLILRSRSRPKTVVDMSVIPEHFIVLDLETTGLNADRNKIIEIAAIKAHRDSNTHETLSCLIKIKGKVPEKITQLTGITDEMIAAEGDTIEEALPKFIEFFGDLRLVSFNAPFDMGFLQAAAKAQGLSIRNPYSCALDMARRAWPGRKSYKLAELAKDGKLTTQSHRALQDCQLALTIYTTAAVVLRSDR